MERVKVNKDAKKKTRPISSHLDQTSLINEGFIISPKRKLFLTGPTREIPSGQNGPILPARVANQNTGFASSCPLADSPI